MDERAGIKDQGLEGRVFGALLGIVESEFSDENTVIHKTYFITVGKLKNSQNMHSVKIL